MDSKLKDELLCRVKVQPKFLKSINKKFKLDFDFFKKAVSYNIESFIYIPDEYKEDLEIVNIVLSNSSTLNTSFPFDKLKISTKEQKKKLENIKRILCYLNLYKIIYGNELIFETELLFERISENNKLYLYVQSILECLDELERDYIIYRYGLIDGCLKSINQTTNKFNLSYNKMRELEINSIKKMQNYIKKCRKSGGLWIK